MGTNPGNRASTTTTALRGSAERGELVPASVPASEAEALDALSDIMFSSEDSAASSESPVASAAENYTGLPSLSAELAAGSGRCHQAWSHQVESMAPGCLGQCQSHGICGTVDRAINKWLQTHSKTKARQAACTNRKALECLTRGSHRAKCQGLINKAPAMASPFLA